jgi:hypothetical protein
MQNLHFLSDKPNTLLIDDIPYKNMFNGPYNAIFLESFDSLRGEDHYVLGIVLFYLESLHFSGYGVSTSTQSLW